MATIKGKWKWNDTIVHPESLEDYFYMDYDISFISNGETFNGIELNTADDQLYIMYMGSSDPNFVYDGTGNMGGSVIGWQNEAYRIIDFGESDITIDDGVYGTLIANATEYIEVPEEYNTKAINLNQLKRVYDNLNDKISNMSSGESSSGIPVLTTQTVNLADLEAGIYKWEYSVYDEASESYYTIKTLLVGDSSCDVYDNPILLQVYSDGIIKTFQVFDNGGLGYDEDGRAIYYGGVHLEDGDGYIFSRRIENIPTEYIDISKIPTFSFDSSTGILTITTNG